jgi:hypothetical protein
MKDQDAVSAIRIFDHVRGGARGGMRGSDWGKRGGFRGGYRGKPEPAPSRGTKRLGDEDFHKPSKK